MPSSKREIEGLVILSQKDIESYFDEDDPRRNSLSLFANSSSKKDLKLSGMLFCDQSSQNSARNSEEGTLRSNDLTYIQRQQYEKLQQEINVLANDLYVSQKLSQELITDKEKIVDEMRFLKKSYEKVQQERNKLQAETVHLRNQVNSMRATIFINSQKIQTLSYSNQIMVEELNFQKQLLADYKQQNVQLKTHLGNVISAFSGLKQQIYSQNQRQIAQIKQILNQNINQLQQESKMLLKDVNQIQNQTKALQKYKVSTLNWVKKLQSKINFMAAQSNIKALTGQNEQNQKSIEREKNYKNSISKLNQQIKKLNQEITHLKNNQKDTQNNPPQVEPLGTRIHTNTQYVNKIIKQNGKQVKQIKLKLQAKQTQISKLNEQYEQAKDEIRRKNEQLSSINAHINAWQNNKCLELTDQIEDINVQNVRLLRKMDQMSQSVSSLKLEIAEKDRIILKYVEKYKKDKISSQKSILI